MTPSQPILHVNVPKPKLNPAVIEAARGYYREKMFGPSRVPTLYQRLMLFPSYNAMLRYMYFYEMIHEHSWN